MNSFFAQTDASSILSFSWVVYKKMQFSVEIAERKSYNKKTEMLWFESGVQLMKVRYKKRATARKMKGVRNHGIY